MPRRSELALLLAVCLAVAVVLGLASGAASSGLGAYEDEPAHVATALMMRDWVATLDPLHPVRFAEEYYAVYPKVAVGQWPPVLHGALAAWMLVFGVSTLTIVVFGWVLAALTGWLAAALVVRELAPGGGERMRGGLFALAAAAGGLVVAMPLVQSLSGAAMTEVPMALLGTLGAALFGRWMAAPTVMAATKFGVVAVLAILTKGSGLALALVPPLALVLNRTPRLAMRPSLVVAPLVVAALCAPWYVLSLPIARASWSEGASPSLEFVRRAFTYYPREVVALAGGVVLVFAVVGALERLTRPDGRERAASLAAWLLALAGLHAVVPSSLEARHLVAAAPALAFFAGCGAHVVVRALVARGAVRLAGSSRTPLAAASLLVVGFLLTGFRVVRKDCHGFDEAAGAVLADPALRGCTVLVASGATGEGLGVLGFALQESPRRQRQVLRASKVLASATWIGSDYEARFADAAEVAAFLADVPVTAVLLDGATPARQRFPHLEQLREALRADVGTWRRAASFDVTADGELHPGALELWLAEGHARRVPRQLSLDEVLGRRFPEF